MPALDFSFERAGPWVSHNTVADSCHPPFSVSKRGLYFDGASFLQLKNFYLHSSYTFALWAKVNRGNGIMLNYEFKLWEGWDEWNRDADDVQMHKIFEDHRINSLMVTSCNTFCL
jgi:hypothetical protein